MPTNLDLRELAVHRGHDDAPGRPRRRHFFTRYAIPGALLSGFVAVVGWSLRDVLLPATPVTVVPVKTVKGEVSEAGTPLFRAPAWIEPRPTSIRAAALASGVVQKLLVVENESVEEGQPVAQLVSRDAELAVAAAKAELDLRKSESKQADAAFTAAETNFNRPVHLQAAHAEAEAEHARLNTELANLPFEVLRAKAREAVAAAELESRTKAKGVVSELEIEKARGELDSAKATTGELANREPFLQKEVAAAASHVMALHEQLQLKTAERRALDDARAMVQAAKAKVDQAQVALDEAELRLARMVVRAPVKGRVQQLRAIPGTFVNAEMRRGAESDAATVVTLYQPDRIQARVDVRFEDLPRVQSGQPVLIENAALEHPVPGKVLFITASTNIQKNTVEVKVVPDHCPELLRPDMLMDVTFLAAERPAGTAKPTEQTRIFVPTQLVEVGEDGSYVWVADQTAGVARHVKIQTGRKSGELIEVASGLQMTSRLIVEGRNGLKEGQRIRVTRDDPSLGVGSTGTTSQPAEHPSGAAEGKH
ncbi:MAG: efflux RND transporter periplasmic adaptor subunit [Planctomycetia bacterium]|nr:efflux RND transporter periplasmic adaptor subunit [Planctomycetia bacterium]